MRCPPSILFALLTLALGVHADAPRADGPFVAYFDDTPSGVGLADELRRALARKMPPPAKVPRVDLVAVDLADKQVLREAMQLQLRKRPAAIVAGNSNAAMVAQSLTRDVPIVFASHEDPVALRLAQSLARPGGNLTGFTYFVPVDLKRLELLRELAPHARKLGILIDQWWLKESAGSSVVRAARDQLGFEAELFQAESLGELKEVLATPRAKSMDAWYVPAPALLPYQHPDAVVLAISGMRRPVMYPAAQFVEKGGLVSYGQLLPRHEAVALLATALALVLGGVPPGEIPIERPKAFELAVNVPAARALGMKLPEALIMRADRVITQ